MDPLYCLCGQPYDQSLFMIQCDSCRDWFHGSCVRFPEHVAIEIDKYHCPRCVPVYGPSIYKPYRNWHRHDYWDEDAGGKPVQTGTPVFIKELRARHFASEGEVVVHMRGQQLTDAYLQQQGFNSPIVVDQKDGLDITLPSENFSIFDVESYIGGDYEMDVIDCTRQTDIKMTLREFVAYYNSLDRNRVFNVVSLEFSNTSLSRLVEAPLVARKLDWVNTVWPKEYPYPKPTVQKYCLMSVKDAYTDFHIDFGGTSVWYHVLRGEKIFYLIRPTVANLTLYQQWMTSSNQSETFFGDQVDQCFKCTLRQGQTMFIPTGWIHAVLTPVDSLVFGGNFLHSLNIPMQLHVYDIEKKIKTAEKFRYPHFETVNWFAAKRLLQEINEINVQERRCPETLLVGLKALLPSLRHWNTEKDYSTSTREQIPFIINAAKLIKDISKEIRHAERYINSLNPPKPERESKRKRKKPVNKDFVDYSDSPNSSLQDFLVEPEEEYKPPIKLTLPKTQVYSYTTSPTNSREHASLGTWGSLQYNPTTTVHEGGTVLKFKFGARPDTQQDGSMLQTSNRSVYDFHEGSDRDEDGLQLSIDDSPRRAKKQTATATTGSLRIRLPAAVGSRQRRSRQEAAASDSQATGPDGATKNGIDTLIRASNVTITKYEAPPTGRTSPSTQEAIVGMLSISQTTTTTTTYMQAGRSGGGGNQRRYLNSPPSSPEDEGLNNVHQDEDYVYPSLDNSDDEEECHIFKPRGRSKVDEAWNPKARVGPLLPKMNRPAREGTKKQAVEKVLEAAAAKRATESPEKSPKRQYRRKKVKPKLTKPVPVATATPSTSVTAAAATAPAVKNVPLSTPSPKLRKGMKTVKQRLGKILKIHKMIH